jgi:ABC-type hemin transport system ATPase subunit
MKIRHFFSDEQGMFVSVDGPSGAGKSTIVRHLARMLVANGENVHVTAEPSTGIFDRALGSERMSPPRPQGIHCPWLVYCECPPRLLSPT